MHFKLGLRADALASQPTAQLRQLTKMGAGASSVARGDSGWEPRGEPVVFNVGGKPDTADASFIFLHGFTGGADSSQGWAGNPAKTRGRPRPDTRSLRPDT